MRLELAFMAVLSPQGCDSAPKLAAGQRGPLCQRLEFGPVDLRMNATAQTAVGRGDDPLPSDEIREPQNALGNKLRVLDNVGRMADDAWQDQLVIWQSHLLPNLPLMFMADIAGFERIRVRVDRQHDLDDVAHRDIRDVRAVPATPTQVETDAIMGQTLDRVVERLDADHRELLVLLHRRLGVDHVP